MVQPLSYWDDYYQTQKETSFFNPSQFAVFVLDEMKERTLIYDIGCGNGRDSFFFAQAGHCVIGIDKSNMAIEKCRTIESMLLRKFSLDTNFINMSLEAALTDDQLVKHKRFLPRLVYSRFFLHAITDEEERGFLKLVACLCHTGDMLAVEFRTVRDSMQKKITQNHYRRFLNSLDTVERLAQHGFKPNYFIEGFGFAKYHEDDAYVARCILEKR